MLRNTRPCRFRFLYRGSATPMRGAVGSPSLHKVSSPHSRLMHADCSSFRISNIVMLTRRKIKSIKVACWKSPFSFKHTLKNSKLRNATNTSLQMLGCNAARCQKPGFWGLHREAGMGSNSVSQSAEFTAKRKIHYGDNVHLHNSSSS